MTRPNIIARHRASLNGVLRACLYSSTALGIRKPYYVYEPPQVKTHTDLPVIYLFRGHEREWVNIDEDSSRTMSTAIEDIDKAITLGMIPPILVVMPGLNSANNHVPSLGINMVGQWPKSLKGLGSGNFWDFLTEELMPAIKARYPQTRPRSMAAGFSLGGFTTSLLAINKPHLFERVAIYDGLFMWPEYHDPRATPDEAYNDTIWTKGGLFHPAFGNPRIKPALRQWNPTDKIISATEEQLATLRQTTWSISCAVSDGQHGNRDRAEYYRDLLTSKEIPLSSENVLLDEAAAHSWHWADTFLISFLLESLSK